MTQELGWPPKWHSASGPKLWLYHLHYFEWLWALPYALARESVLDWIAHCSLNRAPMAWEPYPLSLRVMNWCGFFWHSNQPELSQDRDFRRRLWESLYLQIEWLTRHLETHLLGNHLLENAAALALAGSAFFGPDAARWLALGEQLLARELPQQMLTDGMHFERSPMYHARVTRLLLVLNAAGNWRMRALIVRFLRPALEALRALCHPDGDIALLNDSALGSNSDPSQIIRFAESFGILTHDPQPVGPWSLPVAGYYGYRDPHGFYLVCDAGAIGPDHLPGHAHGDMFSFELSRRGRRLIVDSGVFDYVGSEMRQYCRSTRAHNTVTVGGQDQCEFWRAFRVARRGRPHDVSWRPGPTGFRLSGWHDGYQRLQASPLHARRFSWHNDGVLMVRDEIESAAQVEAVSRVHLHPDCEIVRVKNNVAQIRTPVGCFALRFAGPGALELEDSYYCPEFGKRLANRALAWRFERSKIPVGFCFTPGLKVDEFNLESGALVSGRHYLW